MSTQKIILTLLALSLTVQAEPLQKRGLQRLKSQTQHALVIGINHYKAAKLRDLAGAVNDATLLKKALRQAGVQLPDERILLDAQATRLAFIQAWQNMLKQAKPGDTLILTFAGHGGQEPDMAPLGEKDGFDETLLFHDFNPPNQGRISDDELYGIFEKAREYKILVLIDACHSSGMVRSITQPLGRFRSAGFWPNQPYAPPPFPTLPKSEETKPLPHVTMITAVHNDRLQVPETILDNKHHGVLSWFFAQAITGKADGNQNGRLERNELESFLNEKVTKHMNHLQKPKILHRADKLSVFNLAQKPPYPERQTKIPDIAISVQNGTMPDGLKHIQLVNTAFELRFVIKNRQTTIFNHTGDKITTLNATQDWQPVIDKARLLKTLETQFDMRLSPIQISLREGDGLHKKGDFLHFSLGDSKEKLNALTLFSLAANGELQFLYPLSEYKDPLIVRQFPLKLPPMEIEPPLGSENFIVILCRSVATGLHKLLARVQPQLLEPEPILSQLRNNRCQVGQYAVFSD
jgi:hypothetical protein